MKTENALDRHPHVKKAITMVNSTDHNLNGFYWREKVVEVLASQYHTQGPNKGKITEAAEDWADMAMTEYENDNG